MKRLTATLALMISLMLIASTGFAQQKKADMPQKKQQMMEMMQDSTMRSMMMDQMTQNPEMRKQMMEKMMKNPEMKERIQKYMQLMQPMIEGKMDPSKMKGMMADSSMMKMNIMCMQLMMQGDMMDKNAMKSGNGNHEQPQN